MHHNSQSKHDDYIENSTKASQYKPSKTWFIGIWFAWLIVTSLRGASTSRRSSMESNQGKGFQEKRLISISSTTYMRYTKTEGLTSDRFSSLNADRIHQHHAILRFETSACWIMDKAFFAPEFLTNISCTSHHFLLLVFLESFIEQNRKNARQFTMIIQSTLSPDIDASLPPVLEKIAHYSIQNESVNVLLTSGPRSQRGSCKHTSLFRTRLASGLKLVIDIECRLLHYHCYSFSIHWLLYLRFP